VLEQAPPSEVAGLYFKGSARKRWDSPVDYVPETSDVDIHVLFSDDACAARRLGTMESALQVQGRIETGYQARVPSPLHTPRPQLMILNDLLRDPEYSPSPPGTVTTLHGATYPDATYDEARERSLARMRLLSHSDVVGGLPLRAVDKPGRYQLSILRDLAWRVSPSGPRLLTILGLPSPRAWQLNRTEIIGALEESGQRDMAKAYRDFYLFAWAYFLSAYADSEAARSAVAAGAEVLELGAAAAGAPSEAEKV